MAFVPGTRLGGYEILALVGAGNVSERPMLIPITTTARPQQRYDHRLQALVRRTGDVTIATDLGVPRSTARGWLGAVPMVVVSLDLADRTEPELRQEILKLRRRIQKLAALFRVVLAVVNGQSTAKFTSRSRGAIETGRPGKSFLWAVLAAADLFTFEAWTDGPDALRRRPRH